MFWHLLLMLTSPLSALVTALLRGEDDCDRQIPALRQQIIILQRQLGKRPQVSRAGGSAPLLVCARTKQRQLRGCLRIVEPATLVGWHDGSSAATGPFAPRADPGGPGRHRRYGNPCCG